MHGLISYGAARTIRRLRIAALAACVAIPSCTSHQSSPEKKDVVQTADIKRRVGELERLGKNEQDFLVLGIDAPGFDKLAQRQKILLYYLYRAAIAGNQLADQQNHRHALEIRTLLEQIFLHSEQMEPGL